MKFKSSESTIILKLKSSKIAMPSAIKACGEFDHIELFKALKKYFETHINISSDGFIVYE